jgi:hypothetical protein
MFSVGMIICILGSLKLLSEPISIRNSKISSLVRNYYLRSWMWQKHLVQEHTITCKVLSSHSSEAENWSLQGGTTVLLGERYLTFRTDVVPLSLKSCGSLRILLGLQTLRMKAV